MLAGQLKHFAGKNVVVLGIPRGGVIIAAEIARQLHAELDIALSRKLGAPDNPELAIGSIGEDGQLILNEELAARVGAGRSYIEAERERQLTVIRERVQRFRMVKPKLLLKGKTVIIADDGIATGATLQAALVAVRREHPARLIAAVPVGARESVELLSEFADELIVLRVPDSLGAISQFYGRFDQISDEEVSRVLQKWAPSEELRGVI